MHACVGTGTGEYTLVVELATVEKTTTHICAGNISDGQVLVSEANISEGEMAVTPSTLLGDLTKDGKVDIDDVIIPALAFGSYPGHPRWNPIADLNEDDKVDIDDVVLVAIHFGEHI